jgi:hypothetical protein
MPLSDILSMFSRDIVSSSGNNALRATERNSSYEIDEPCIKKGAVPQALLQYTEPYTWRKPSVRMTCDFPWCLSGPCCFKLKPRSIERAYDNDDIPAIHAMLNGLNLIESHNNNAFFFGMDKGVRYGLTSPVIANSQGGFHLLVDHIYSAEMWTFILQCMRTTTSQVLSFEPKSIVFYGKTEIRRRCHAAKLMIEAEIQHDKSIRAHSTDRALEAAEVLLAIVVQDERVEDSEAVSIAIRFQHLLKHIVFEPLKWEQRPGIHAFTPPERPAEFHHYPKLWNYVRKFFAAAEDKHTKAIVLWKP